MIFSATYMIRGSAASRICPKGGTFTVGRRFAAAYPAAATALTMHLCAAL
jgi:hypothetical protein